LDLTVDHIAKYVAAVVYERRGRLVTGGLDSQSKHLWATVFRNSPVKRLVSLLRRFCPCEPSARYRSAVQGGGVWDRNGSFRGAGN
jgi:hypothetical protein